MRVKCLEAEVRAIKERMKRWQGESTSASASLSAPQVGLESDEGLAASVKHLTDEIEILKTLTFQIFTREEIKNCYLTGKKTAKCQDRAVRPALDQAKLQKLEGLVRQKCPGLSHKQFMEKLQNVQKVLRKKTKLQA